MVFKCIGNRLNYCICSREAIKEREILSCFDACGGVLLDEYHKFFHNPILEKAAEAVVYIGGARHAIFFAVPMLLIGSLIATREGRLLHRQGRMYLSICALLFVLGFVEATLLKNFIGIEITSDVTLFGWTPAIPLLLLGLSTKTKLSVEKSRRLRKITDVVYIVHVWAIKFSQRLIGVEYFAQFLIVLFLSSIIAIIFVLLIEKQQLRMRKI